MYSPGSLVNYAENNLEESKMVKFDVEFFLTAVKVENGVDKVKQKAESDFIQCILSHCEDKDIVALKALGFQKKPEINDRLKEIVSRGLAENFYKEYAKIWVPYAIWKQDDTDLPSLKEMKRLLPKREEELQNQLIQIEKKYRRIMALQQSCLYDNALTKLTPRAYYYLTYGKRNKFPEKLQNYLEQPENIHKWAKTQTIEDYAVHFGALKGLIDFIDPSQKISSETLPKYLGYFFLVLVSDKNNFVKNDKYNKFMNTIITSIVESQDKGIKGVISGLTSLGPFGTNSAGITVQLFNVFEQMLDPNVDSSNIIVSTKYEEKLVNILKRKGVTASQMNSAKTYCNVIFRIFQFSIIALTGGSDFVVADDIDKVKLSAFLIDASGNLVDLLSSFSVIDDQLTKFAGKLTLQICKIVPSTGLTFPQAITNFVTRFRSGVTWFFTDKVSKFAATRLGPLMLFIGGCFNFYEAYKSWGNGIVEFSLNLSSAIIGVSAGIATFVIASMGFIAVSGLVGLVASLVLVTISVIKSKFYDPSQKDAIRTYLIFLGEPTEKVEEILRQDIISN